MNRIDTLDIAKKIITGDREGTYGKPEDSFSRIAEYWTTYLDLRVTPSDVANMMILLKVARNGSGVYKNDNWVDICGYSALGSELQDTLENNTDKENL